MRWPAPVRKAVGAATASLATIALGVTVGVFVAGPAAASSTSPTTTSTSPTSTSPLGVDPDSPAARYFVINATVNAASDHIILGSSAFPNYSTGAIDNYYSLAHAHVDNSPFAQGTGSPFDTGPIGQTAAAGNVQQPQYADARWPGSNSGKATYGSEGGPYAVAEAGEYKAKADASVASSALNAPGTPGAIAAPKGLDLRLRKALAAWKAKWQDRLKPPTVPTPSVPVPTPTAPVPTPTVTVGGLTTTPRMAVPTAPVPTPAVPSATPSRSLSGASGDGTSLLESSTRAILDPKTHALVTSGESRLGRVSLGGGQILIEGIHVSAKITNDGTPSEEVTVSIGSATIGGVPVTIDEDGVHVAGQGQGLPYRQASDSLNNALKQAGIKLFLVAPEIEKGSGSCDQSGTTTGATTTTSSSTSTSTRTSTSDQSGATPPQGSCDQTDTTTTTTTDKTGPTTTTSSCTGTGPTSGGTTTTSSTDQTSTSTTTGPFPTPPAGDTTNSSSDTTNPGQEVVTATGVHLLFTQPVAQSGVPAQYAEHILGEVFVDSLAVAAGPVPKFDLSPLSSSCLGGSHFGKKKKTTGGGSSTGGGGSAAGGSTALGSSASPSSSSPAASFSGSSQPSSGWTGSGTEPTSSSPGDAVPASSSVFSSVLKKPLWLLVAYLLWQALVIATGASLWKWRRGGTS